MVLEHLRQDKVLYDNFGLNAKEIVKLALRIYKKNNG